MIYKAPLAVLRLIIGWLIAVPLSLLIPKSRSIVCIPRFGSNFSGNLKYMYLYLHFHMDTDWHVRFVTTSRRLQQQLEAAGLCAVHYPSLYGTAVLLRARIVVVDGNEWIKALRFHLLWAARKIQLWHGSGMKTVGMQKTAVQRLPALIRGVGRLLGQHPCYDVLCLNSRTQLETRGPAFRYIRCLINGQPRNDILFHGLPDDPVISTGIAIGADACSLQQLQRAYQEGRRIILYAPTHRKPSAEFSRLMHTLNPEALNLWARQHHAVVVFKYHPKTLPDHRYCLDGLESLWEYPAGADIYPALALVDVLITDYSSIFVDFLLTGRRVVFFPFDFQHYVHSERPLQFEYDTVTPGPKCSTMEQLQVELGEALAGTVDRYLEQREKVVKIFYDYRDGNSCSRVREALQQLETST